MSTTPAPSTRTLRRHRWIAGCARRVLVEDGYAGLTHHRVAWMAGTDVEAVRWTFADRRSLAVAAVTEELPAFRLRTDDPRAVSDGLDALELWRDAVAHRALLAIAPLEALVDSRGVEADVLDEVHRRLVGPTRRSLDAILDSGSTSVERDLLCGSAWATAALEAVCRRHVGDLPGLRHVIAFVMRPVPAAPAAALVA